MENPIFVMSLSGTFAFLLYKAIYPFARRYFHPMWRYIFLKVILVFYLMPIPLLLNWIRGTIKDFIQSNKANANAIITFNNLADSIAASANSVMASPYFIALLFVSICFGTVSFLLVCFQTYRYIREKRECLQSGYDIPQYKFQEDLAAINLQRDVKFMASRKAKTPFVIGVLKPVIILPAPVVDTDDETVSVCIRHELMHIKKNDIIYRLLSLLAVCIHWFNPFCHWFRKELIVVSEICCDHEVLGTIPKSQRKHYYNALISIAASLQSKSQNWFLSTFADKSSSELKRRILELETIDTSKLKLLAVFSCTLVALVGIVGTLTYSPYPLRQNPNYHLSISGPDASSIDDPSQLPDAVQADSGLDSNNQLTLYNPNASSNEFVQPMPFACYFADEYGTVYALNPEQGNPSCVHEFVSGTIVEHIQTSGSSCTVAYYQGKRCVVCGFLEQGIFVYQRDSNECNHTFIDEKEGE